MEEKKAIRKQVFAARKAHTDQQIDDWSRKIAETVTALPEYSNSRRILAYADYNHEVMTKYIIEAAWNDGKEVAVPKVVGQDMVFYKLTDFAQLEKGYFGIPEPARGEIVQWEEALMIMPGVAFDRQNHRVGYGGGFYDKYLEKHPDTVIICDEVGNGIVPLDSFEREYRERLGRLLCEIAAKAERVERIVCGIGQRIK